MYFSYENGRDFCSENGGDFFMRIMGIFGLAM
jgi:hypothetical protein